MKSQYDVVIIGGGMVGLAAALALAKLKLDVAVIEQHAPKAATTDYDLRVIAINQASINFFVELGVWSSLIKQRHGTFEHMHVWVDKSELDFHANEVEQMELGFIVENQIIRATLWQAAEQNNNVDIISPAELTSVTINDQVELSLNQQTLQAKLIIGADGVNSWLRQQLDFPVKTKDYQHHALVTRVHTSLPHQNTAWQHFLNDGPLAFLPLAEPNLCSIVWSTKPDNIADLKNMNDENFNQAISHAFQQRLGEVTTVAPRVSFPLERQHLQDYVAPQVAFIGDAAHRIHPLAGQGANLGFMDAKCLAATVAEALYAKKDFNSLRVLKRYQRERKYYNQQMLLMMDVLKNTFQTQKPLFSTLRNLGIETLQKHQHLKTIFSKVALG